MFALAAAYPDEHGRTRTTTDIQAEDRFCTTRTVRFCPTGQIRQAPGGPEISVRVSPCSSVFVRVVQVSAANLPAPFLVEGTTGYYEVR